MSSEFQPSPLGPVGTPFEAVAVSVDGHVVLMVRGEIDPSTADRFAAAIDGAFGQAPRVVIDLSGVTFMDSTGIRTLIQAFQHTGQNHEALAIRAPSEFVRRVLSITRLDEVLTVEGDAAPDRQGAR